MRSVAESAAYHLSGLYLRIRGKSLADLAVDPVCHMRVDPANAAATRRHNETEIFFCSSRCARRFESDPGRYQVPAPG